MMPGFFKHMPKPEGGKWVAVVLKNIQFRGRGEYMTAKVTGLRRAYIVARLMALYADLTVPLHDGRIGIDWAVRKDEPKA